jgi:hypothetical protein
MNLLEDEAKILLSNIIYGSFIFKKIGSQSQVFKTLFFAPELKKFSGIFS